MGLRNFSGVAYLIDFGLSSYFEDDKGKHIQMDTSGSLIGTATFASPYSHLGHELSRRDDLISLGYLVYFLYNGSLPWIGLTDPQSARCKTVAKNKAEFTRSIEARLAPHEFKVYLEYCIELGFEEKPDYRWLLGLIEGLAR